MIVPVFWRTQALGLKIEATEEELYRGRIGEILAPRMVLAMGLVLLGVVFVLVGRRKHALPAAVVAVLFSAAAIALGVNTNSKLISMLRPYEPQLATLETFEAPSEWRLLTTIPKAAEHPGVTGIWEVPGSLQEACGSVESELRQWADRDTTASKPTAIPSRSCSFEARKGSDRVRVSVQLDNNDPPASVSITLVDIEKISPEQLG